MEISLICPAKVNLVLRVLARRDDGFHEIETLMAPLSLSDELTITLTEGDSISLTTDMAGLSTGPDNLAYKAAEKLLAALSVKRGVTIDIKKKIPIGAGLAGGSTDAAGVIKALLTLFPEEAKGLSKDDIVALAASLGSDVPFFLAGGGAICRGRGEKCEPITLPKHHFVLINPGFEISAAWGYANLDLTKTPENNILFNYIEVALDSTSLSSALSNDLEEAAIREFPEIGDIKERLIAKGALGALMSGSGPTVFGLYESGEAATKAHKALMADAPRSWRVILASSL